MENKITREDAAKIWDVSQEAFEAADGFALDKSRRADLIYFIRDLYLNQFAEKPTTDAGK